MALALSTKSLQTYSKELGREVFKISVHRGHSTRSVVPSHNTLKNASDKTVSLEKKLLSTTASLPRVHNSTKIVSNPIAWYASKLESHPLLTKCITSAFIAGSGDLVCQYITHCQSKEDTTEIYSTNNSTFTPDINRTGRFAFIGMTFVAPMAHSWFGFLGRYVPGTSFGAALKRVVLDQIIFAPFMIPGFMTNIMLLEGRPTNEIKTALIRNVPDAYVTNLAVWVPALLVNFKYVPGKWQVLFSNVVGFGWNIYLSYKTQKD
mmetsp:Transcript_13143/g.15449  ORF Transcript_13143/g.15449 Transcript_13143/m.15449 type:complete len:263 (-) Transcript_13143:92-880(-)